ncbi:hypothetical protein PAXRUDRAFT_621660 [Paxillus rubicundulus Ve08.2h10]|uniref:SPT2 chromatin protein n=1 Tax=Paxillus rubicundulus Ve08.2h10 TaxID=930991 RepID=A0A0D0E3G7_9AGAM|nr:hypothetical protein PAXRUDRAFT_621660 [Paxillus rubicundulus Ve08.2h10]
MSGFAALMALSASQTKEAQNAVQTALQQRQRNEELKRKKQEDLERKQREEDAKLRQKRFEDDKKQRELEARKEAEQARLEAEQARREEEVRATLLHGPKKARHQGPRWPSSSTGAKEEVRRRGLMQEGDDASRAGSPAMALTREEKRRRRVEAELRRTYQLKRNSSFFGYSKAGRPLPGGAIDATSAPTSESGAPTQSVKARLAALPNTLTKLNVNKRDTRTIDEILQDRAKAKIATLDGDEAREFSDWFGKAKKKESSGFTSTQSSATLASAHSSGANSPKPLGTKAASQSTVKSLASTTKTPSQSSSTKPSSQYKHTPNTKAPSSSSKMALDSKYPFTVAKSARSRSPASQLKSQPSKSTSGAKSGAAPPRKRPRSPSLSLSPPPQKRRTAFPQDAIRSEIWKLFGKDRHSYVARDVLSDDEDMEADADVVMREEMRSARLAKREDEQALEAEKRHEEEKRRRKRERERQGL